MLSISTISYHINLFYFLVLWYPYVEFIPSGQVSIKELATLHTFLGRGFTLVSWQSLIPMTDPVVCHVYGLPFAINIPPNVSINLPYDWIRHGIDLWHFRKKSTSRLLPAPNRPLTPQARRFPEIARFMPRCYDMTWILDDFATQVPKWWVLEKNAVHCFN